MTVGLTWRERNTDMWEEYYCARALISIGRTNEGAAVLVEIARTGRKRSIHPQARKFSARNLFDLGREADARLLLLREAAEPESEGDDLVEIAEILNKSKNQEDGVRVLQQVAGTLEESPLYRLQAARALAELGDRSEVISLLRSMILDKMSGRHINWLGDIAKTLKELGSPIDLVDTLRHRASDRSVSPGQRLRAAVELAKQGYREATAALRAISMEQSAPSWVREEAKSHLFCYSWLSPREPRLVRDTRWRRLLRDVKIFATGTLMRVFHHPQRWQYLLMQTWIGSGNGRAGRCAAVEALASAKRIGELLALLSNPATDRGEIELVRPLAIETLALSCPTSDLVDLASDETAAPEGRIEAARALALAERTDELRSVLHTIMRDRAMDYLISYRSSAVSLMKALHDTDTLISVLRDSSFDALARIWCAYAALELGIVDEVTEVARFNGTEPWIRVRVAEQLGNLGRGGDACEILLDVALDLAIDLRVRAAAVTGLGSRGQVTKLRELSLDETLEIDIRKEALWRLGDPVSVAAEAHLKPSSSFIDGLPPALRTCAVDAEIVANFRTRNQT